MSDCFRGGRAVYERECVVEVLFSDGTARRLPLNLGSRKVVGVQVDGELLEPADVDEHYELDGRGIRAIVLEGMRYVPAPPMDYDVVEVD